MLGSWARERSGRSHTLVAWACLGIHDTWLYPMVVSWLVAAMHCQQRKQVRRPVRSLCCGNHHSRRAPRLGALVGRMTMSKVSSSFSFGLTHVGGPTLAYNCITIRFSLEQCAAAEGVALVSLVGFSRHQCHRRILLHPLTPYVNRPSSVDHCGVRAGRPVVSRHESSIMAGRHP